ncbi:tape measure protein [Novosphingobium naphthalenivorans]|uniref:tape measure protein n=1 Tax=Novosphingobium naphthalenivorans TaxID=273168 RepID=UPI000835CB8F|nr:tape measure protein [Novosphingobium naphthalenivorans]
MALKFSFILEAVDRATAPAKRIRSTYERLIAGVRKWGREVRSNARDIETGARSLEHYQRRAQRLRRVALGTFFRAARMQADRFVVSLNRGIAKLKLLERAGRAAGSGLRWIGGKALGLAKWGAAGASAFAGWSIFDMFKKGGQFEQYQIMLEGMEGSSGKARKAMRWVQNFAQTTPYELDQVMEAFVALKAYGIDPLNGSLESLGDGASGMSKDLMQAVEALADAVTGEYERLKEFGIRASKAGDKVTFTYRKNGKDIQRTVKATGDEIEKTITGIFSDRFGGGMLRQSKTLFGIISNLKDLWSKFQLMVADAGIYDRVKRKLDEWRGRLDAMSKDNRMKAWAERISDKLEQAFDWGVRFAEETDWAAVGRGLGSALVAMTQLVALFGQAVDKYMRWQATRAAAMAENTEQGWFSSRQAKDDARRRRKAIERQYGPLTDSGRKDAEEAARKGNTYRVTPGGRDIPKGVQPSWPNKSKETPYQRGLRIGQQSATPTKVGGALDINVKVQGPGTARVERVQTANRDVPINARVGKIMGAPA